MDRDCIEKSRKRPGESDSAGNKRARLDRRNRNDRDRRRNETEEKLRLAKRRERNRVKKKKEKKKLLNLKHRVARLDLPDWSKYKSQVTIFHPYPTNKVFHIILHFLSVSRQLPLMDNTIGFNAEI